jgi:hypothetical protein
MGKEDATFHGAVTSLIGMQVTPQDKTKSFVRSLGQIDVLDLGEVNLWN